MTFVSGGAERINEYSNLKSSSCLLFWGGDALSK
jgi:hypothetical protein